LTLVQAAQTYIARGILQAGANIIALCDGRDGTLANSGRLKLLVEASLSTALARDLSTVILICAIDQLSLVKAGASRFLEIKPLI
jgi:hypothetical protein